MDRPEPPLTDAESATTAWLRARIDGLRHENALLKQELAAARNASRIEHHANLVEANGRLVISALHAEEATETAASELGRLTWSSQRDALTQTPNRALMLDRLRGAFALAERHGTRAAVLFLDLDRFKQINDSLGHAAGDAVLQLVAHRLGSVLRDSDAVSRHSGDEFLVLLTEVSHAADAVSTAKKLLAALAEPTSVSGHTVTLSASVGVAIYPDDGKDPSRLIARADAAMYRST